MNKNQIKKNVKIGAKTKVWSYVNLYDCTIGNECIIGSFVEIQKNAVIGNKVKVGSHSFICEGVTIEDGVFIGHHVVFTNDKYPRSEGEWELLPTMVKKDASIGSNCTILPGITIGENALIGAGSVVTKDVPPHAVVAGNPARVMEKTRK